MCPLPASDLVADLLAATHFETAAALVLGQALEAAESALAGSRFAGQGRLLRGVVHVRPPDGYRRLFGLDHATGASVLDTGYLASASSWRWLVEHGCPLSIDVELGTLRLWCEGAPTLHEERERASAFDGATRDRMRDRDATHAHIIPLRMPGGGIEGMLVLEASCRAAMGLHFPWDACNEVLERLANLAAPHLILLPCQPVTTSPTDELLPVVGASTAGFVEILRVFSRQRETILFQGATGVGKSRLARFCHARSGRPGPFESLDLLGVPEELQMAELFGWKRGAFTGAVTDNPGAVARAEGGTFFLDEIDKLSIKAQAGLLNILEDRTYRHIGDKALLRRADVRFIVGTNVDLRAAVRAGRFREDLYYRINVLPIRVPPLAERLDEVAPWARYMLERHHRDAGREGAATLGAGAEALLVATPWPGNLRQLDNIIRRAYAFALVDRRGGYGDLAVERGHVESALAQESDPGGDSLLMSLWTLAHAFVREAVRRGPAGPPLRLELAEAYRGMILAASVQQLGNREDAFRLLGLDEMLKSRNHHRALKREVERTRELCRAVGGPDADELCALLDEADQEPKRRSG